MASWPSAHGERSWLSKVLRRNLLSRSPVTADAHGPSCLYLFHFIAPLRRWPLGRRVTPRFSSPHGRASGRVPSWSESSWRGQQRGVEPPLLPSLSEVMLKLQHLCSAGKASQGLACIMGKCTSSPPLRQHATEPADRPCLLTRFKRLYLSHA